MRTHKATVKLPLESAGDREVVITNDKRGRDNQRNTCEQSTKFFCKIPSLQETKGEVAQVKDYGIISKTNENELYRKLYFKVKTIKKERKKKAMLP